MCGIRCTALVAPYAGRPRKVLGPALVDEAQLLGPPYHLYAAALSHPARGVDLRSLRPCLIPMYKGAAIEEDAGLHTRE